jgi:DNA-cytosine methyltransferase
MNILSLFDGMSCGQIALNKLGIKYDNYYASEIDKYAIQVTMHNYPQTKHIGSITEINSNEFQDIDLLMGGSSCQNFSLAGNRIGMSTENNIEITNLEQYLELKNNGFKFSGESYLFWEYVRVLKEVKPKYFLLENVKMIKKWEDVITKALGVDPIEINSKNISGQNRPRLYWTNIPNVTNPEYKNITIKDIIESSVDDKYYMKYNYTDYKNRLSSTNPDDLDSSNCIQVAELEMKAIDSIKRVYSTSGKSPCLTTSQGGHRQAKILETSSGRVRKLTPLEYERLQTVPDNYTSILSNAQRYKVLGNGWTVDVIAHIFKGLKNG